MVVTKLSLKIVYDLHFNFSFEKELNSKYFKQLFEKYLKCIYLNWIFFHQNVIIRTNNNEMKIDNYSTTNIFLGYCVLFEIFKNHSMHIQIII